MKRLSKGLACLTAFALVLTLCGGVPASADSESSGKKQRTEKLDLTNQEEALTNQEEGWSWMPDGEGGYILELDGVNISADSGDALVLPDNTDVEIILKGNNRLEGSTALYALNNDAGEVVIREEGAGSLEAVSEDTSGWGNISVSNLTIESGMVTAKGGGSSIDNFTMTGGKFLIDCSVNNGWAPLHTIGRVSITGGLLEISDSSESSDVGAIYNYPSYDDRECGVFIGENAEVSIKGSVHGICVLEGSSEEGKVSVTGGRVTVEASGYGILVQESDILLNGGSICIDTTGKTAISAPKGKADFIGADVKISKTAYENSGGVSAKEIAGTWKELHHPAENWSYNDQEHWKNCLDQGCEELLEKAVHSGGTASCISRAACSVCGQLYGTTDNSHHTNVEYKKAQAPSVGKPGNIEYWHCKDCDAYFSDAGLSNQIDEEGTVIPALEEITEAETEEETTAAEESEEETEASMEATETEGTSESAAESGETSETEESSGEAADENAPGTGDKTSFWFFVILMVMSAGAAAGTLFIRRVK